MSEHGRSWLGLDLSLRDPQNAQERIIKSCAKCFFEKNKTGNYNSGDCSGFVKAVQADLLLKPFDGDANAIYDEVEQRPDWLVLGAGSEALRRAGAAARSGDLVIGVWRNPGGHGHVAIITTFIPLLGQKAEQQAIAGWGQLSSTGTLMGRISQSFGASKHSAIRYAKSLQPVF